MYYDMLNKKTIIAEIREAVIGITVTVIFMRVVSLEVSSFDGLEKQGWLAK